MLRAREAPWTAANGSFKLALVFIGANAFVAAFSYLVIVGEIKRFELKGLKPEDNAGASRATGEVTR